ncbi:pectate lyase [Cellvibrio sp. KY-GH-1]|uniref:pectate lyase n=1 Tax=Cellvibrio sp. KY-GH-1 TaxID=2303332 RepID=UPI0012454BF3|nr:pectate lyase [Cellvibrio sp. KY-GH-1]QEY14704.1 pectate lyase [Cellvibrio sp. KY-GH-1]
MFNKIMITAALIGVSASVMAANRPSGYTTICKIGETCTVSKATNVAFGADDKFVYKVLNGSFSCSVATFGSDPNPAKSVKECSIPSSGTGVSSTSSSKSSVAATSSSKSSVASSSGSTTTSGECKAGAVIENKTVDCGGKTIGLTCPGDAEGQPPVITLKNATIKNVRIAGSGGADGIHCTSGACRAENVVWEDICEDAASLVSSGTKFTISGGSAYNNTSNSPGSKPDKIFQHNSKNSTYEITNGFTAKGVNGKLWRSCGNCSSNGGPRYVVINNVTIDGTIGSIAGVNRNFGDKATIRNLKIKGYKSGSPKVCEEFQGVQKGSESSKYGEYWNTAYCDVSKSDVTAF